MTARRELQKIVDAQSKLLDYSADARGIEGYYEKALAMLHSEKLRKAFNLNEEPQNTGTSLPETAPMRMHSFSLA